MHNILKDHNDQKYRSFKKTNAKIQSTLLSLAGGIDDLITMSGFIPSDDGEKYVFEGMDFKNLRKASKIVDAAIEPTKLKKMSKEERDKYLLLKQRNIEYKAQ